MDIFVLDTSYNTIALVDNFRSLIWTDRYSECGDFELCVPMDGNTLQFLKEDYYLWIKESDHVMIIEDLLIESNAEDGNLLIVTGRSLESILERRVVINQTNLSGNLQNAVKRLLNENVISPTNEDRKINNVVFVDTEDTNITDLTLEMQCFGDDLYSIISVICDTYVIGFQMILNDNNEIEFSLYSGKDRSYVQNENPYVIFSPNFENMINSNFYASKADYKNVAFVAGEGEGSARKTTTVGSGEGLQRREVFTDANGISTSTTDGSLTTSEYNEKLETEGYKTLIDHQIICSFEGEIEATRLFKYRQDFFVGDIVQLEDEYGHEGCSYIPEIVISQDIDGFSIHPTFKTIINEGETEE